MKLFVLLEEKEIGIVLYGHVFDTTFVISLCVRKVLVKVLQRYHSQRQQSSVKSPLNVSPNLVYSISTTLEQNVLITHAADHNDMHMKDQYALPTCGRADYCHYLSQS